MLVLGQGCGKALERYLSAGCRSSLFLPPHPPPAPEAIRDLQGVEEDCGVHTSLEGPEHAFWERGGMFLS